MLDPVFVAFVRDDLSVRVGSAGLGDVAGDLYIPIGQIPWNKILSVS